MDGNNIIDAINKIDEALKILDNIKRRNEENRIKKNIKLKRNNTDKMFETLFNDVETIYYNVN